MLLLRHLFGFGRRAEQPEALYAAVAAQARQPIFYTAYGVPDTLDGRFDLLVLHAALLLRRLNSRPREAQRDAASVGATADDEPMRMLAQEVFDVFFREMDRALREMGVGDLSVPRRVKTMAEVFYGRAMAYDAALAADDPKALDDALARNLFPDQEAPASVSRLARYVRAAVDSLELQPRHDLLAGRLRFPDPSSIP